MRHLLAAIGFLLAGAQGAAAASSESLGTDVAIALPLIAGGITLAKDDWKGSAQLTVDTIATVGVAYGLKHIIREQRPDGSDFQSMACPPMPPPPSWPGAASMPKNIIGTT